MKKRHVAHESPAESSSNEGRAAETPLPQSANIAAQGQTNYEYGALPSDSLLMQRLQLQRAMHSTAASVPLPVALPGGGIMNTTMEAVSQNIDTDPKEKSSKTAAKTSGKGSRPKKPKDMPKRPLSAYNIFFKEERQRILQSIEAPIGYPTADELPDEDGDRGLGGAKRAPHGKIGFESLAKRIATRWKSLSPELLSHYKKLAENDMTRYKQEMDAYHQRKAAKRKHEVEEEMKKTQLEDQQQQQQEENQELERQVKRMREMQQMQHQAADGQHVHSSVGMWPETYGHFAGIPGSTGGQLGLHPSLFPSAQYSGSYLSQANQLFLSSLSQVRTPLHSHSSTALEANLSSRQQLPAISDAPSTSQLQQGEPGNKLSREGLSGQRAHLPDPTQKPESGRAA